jgi:ribosome-binding protein aMBF1 (putative translation factor)
MPERPLTTDELAAELNEKPFTIKRWRRKGIIPAIELGEHTFRFDLASVKAALLKRQVKARAA